MMRDFAACGAVALCACAFGGRAFHAPDARAVIIDIDAQIP